MQMKPADRNMGERLARFAAEHSAKKIPTEALRRVKSGILDYIGVVFAGIHEESVILARKTAMELGGNPQALVWGTGHKTSVVMAAWANATAAHALDLDDTNPVMLAHPSLQLLPGLFALGEYEHCNGHDLLTAYVIGFEIGAVLGRALHPSHIAQGWLPVGTLGPLMQASACARLLRLSPDQTQMALGLASNFASGLRCNNGTMAKHVIAGHAAHGGVWAALLAREGVSANRNAIESRFGYLENFSRAEPDRLDRAMHSLGDRLEILGSGISFKLYPCCAGAHVAIDCALDIAAHHSCAVEEIDSIDVSIHQGSRAVLIYPRPKTPDEARFSLEYAVCRALLDREMGPKQFLPGKIDDPLVRSLMEKVNTQYYDHPLSADDWRESRFPVDLRVKWKDGRVHSSQRDYARGTLRDPLSWADLENKFYRCRYPSSGMRRTESIPLQVNGFERIRDVCEFVEGLHDDV